MARGIRIAVLVSIAGSVIQAQQVAPAAAHHIAAATYDGTHSGGGRVRFTLTPDGSGISRVNATEVSGDFCAYDSITKQYYRPLPITDHAFNDPSTSFSFSGSFPSVQAAQGVMRMTETFPVPCDTGELSWTATTSSMPEMLRDECPEAKRAVRKARAALKKAEGERAEERARRKLNRARARLRAACG
jgi:hypothetical protein